jgi:hypothetical protein
MVSRLLQYKIELILDNNMESLNLIDEYEPNIIEFFEGLKSQNLIRLMYSTEVSQKLVKLAQISNEAINLAKNYHKLYSNSNPDEIKS